MYKIVNVVYAKGDVTKPNYADLVKDLTLFEAMDQALKEVLDNDSPFVFLELHKQTNQTLVDPVAEFDTAGITYFNSSYLNELIISVQSHVKKVREERDSWKKSYFNMLGMEVPNE